MNLTTHWGLAAALGYGIFHSEQIALVMGIGALIPDLDREYFFSSGNFIAKHQLHRALFHNFGFILILYLANPLLALGALTHSLLDMFTSTTDRGVEVLYPATRVVKKYLYNIEGKKMDSQRKVVWWVEDPWRLLKGTSDFDLAEPVEQPWTRNYGPFKNSRIVDWGIFFGSLVFLVIDFFATGGSIYTGILFNPFTLIPFFGIAIFYALGEWWRRKLMKTHPETKAPVLIVLGIGLFVFFIGSYFFLLAPQGIPNLPIYGYAAISGFIGFILSYVFVRMRKKYTDLSL